tara:strand:- start:1673 stop:2170 length:498 start_codon:yes stop_codon:yes gene_type:complete
MNNKINKIGDYLAFIAAGILFSLAGLTVVDVIGRRFFNSPMAGTIEIVELGMAIAAFCAMPRAFLTNSHVSAEFLERVSKGYFGLFIITFRGILMVGIIGLMAIATTLQGIEFLGNNRVTIELEMPFYPFHSIIAVAMWCSAFAALVWVIRAVRADITSEKISWK